MCTCGSPQNVLAEGRSFTGGCFLITIYSSIRGHSEPINRQGILTYAFSLDVTPCKLLNFFPVNKFADFKSEYY
jgi:hypothetical protein